MADYSTELTFALELAGLGGRIALGHFRQDPRSEHKTDGTWVTEADWAAEAQMRLRIARTWPDHNVLGEEEGLTAAGGGPPIDGAPTWVIDPIDGTNNYVAGIPVWATLVGFKTHDEAVVGVCHAPALGETYDAASGLGARMNGEPIQVAPVDDLDEATVVTTGPESFRRRGLGHFLDELTDRCWRSRGFGDFWGHTLVARGAAHIMVEPYLAVWDVLPLLPIVVEAGGKLTHLGGSAWTEPGSCLTTCGGRVHDAVVELAKETVPPG